MDGYHRIFIRFGIRTCFTWAIKPWGLVQSLFKVSWCWEAQLIVISNFYAGDKEQKWRKYTWVQWMIFKISENFKGWNSEFFPLRRFNACCVWRPACAHLLQLGFSVLASQGTLKMQHFPTGNHGQENEATRNTSEKKIKSYSHVSSHSHSWKWKMTRHPQCKKIILVGCWNPRRSSFKNHQPNQYVFSDGD